MLQAKRQHLETLQQRAAERAIKSDQLRDQQENLMAALSGVELQLSEVEKDKHELRGAMAVLAEQIQAEEAEAQQNNGNEPADVGNAQAETPAK